MITKRELILAVGTAVAVVVIVVFALAGLREADAATRRFTQSEAIEYIAVLNYEHTNFKSVRPAVFTTTQEYIRDLSYKIKARKTTDKETFQTSEKSYTIENYEIRRMELVNIYLGI